MRLAFIFRTNLNERATNREEIVVFSHENARGLPFD